MRAWLAFWIPVAVVLALGFRITALVFGFGDGESAVGSAISGASFVLAIFTEAVVLRFDWWVTLAVLAVVFHTVHRERRDAPAPDAPVHDAPPTDDLPSEDGSPL